MILLIAMSMLAQARILDLESTTEGALVLRMTSVQENAIPTPAQSLLVYDPDTKSFWYFKDSAWSELGANEAEGLMSLQGIAAPGTAIPDNDNTGITSTTTLIDPSTIDVETELRVCLNITHSYVSDLDISLTAPDGTTTMFLMTDNGFGGDNYTNTWFSDMSTLSIVGVPAAGTTASSRISR